MDIIKIINIIFLFVLTSTALLSQGFEDLKYAENDFEKVRTILHNEYVGNADLDTIQGIKQFKRWEWFWEQRLLGSVKVPNSLEIIEISEQYSSKNIGKKNQVQAVTWKQYGPFETPAGKLKPQGIGRINDIAIDKSDGGRIIVGTAGGGAWISTNAGQNWNVIRTTDQLSTTISDVEISESNPNVIYIGTGDANGALGSSIDYYSEGLLKSTDGGITFNKTTLSYMLSERKNITRILINPSDENIVFVATSDGIYKTVDGGKKWGHVFEGIPIKDMEFKPDDSNIIYAATMRSWDDNLILKSIDNGQNWNVIRTIPNTLRVEMDVTESAPNNLYFVSCAFNRAFSSFQLSTDAGETWSVQSSIEENNNILGREEGEDISYGQGSYDLAIIVYPQDENVVFVGGINIWYSIDKGKSFTKYTHWTDNNKYPIVHADQHQFAFSHNGGYLYVANDGGLYRNHLDAELWEELNNGMDITQFYRLGVSQSSTFDIMSGAQDNGTSRLTNQSWVQTNGGDGMECAYNPANPDILYNTYQNGHLLRSINNGNTFITVFHPSFVNSSSAWLAPFVVNQVSPNEVLMGYEDVWLNENFGNKENWSKISDFEFPKYQPLRSLAVSSKDDNYIYATNYTNLMKTSNKGVEWSEIANSNYAITDIAINPDNPEEIYITKSGYSESEKVNFYDGKDWVDITGNLPAIPINTIVIENFNNKSVYIGTDIGVFYSEFNNGRWVKLDGEMPNTVVSELEIHKATNKLFAATYGRGIWSTDLLNCNSKILDLSVLGSLELCQGDSVILESKNNYSNYLWNTGETTKSIVVKKSGNYMLTVPNSEFCSDISEIINISVKEEQIIADDGIVFCTNEEQKELSIPEDVIEFKWSNGETKRTIFVTEPGIYSYSGLNSLGCISTDTIRLLQSSLTGNVNIEAKYNKLSVPNGFNYQWYFEGVAIPNSNVSELIIDNLGRYSVEITDEFGCKLFSNIANITTDVSDINPDIQIDIYPNPVEEKLNINIGNIDIRLTLFKMYNSFGKEVANRIINPNMNTSIDVRDFQSGVYFVRVSLKNNIYYKKIIIK